MTWDDLPLLLAVHTVAQRMEQPGRDPRSDGDWEPILRMIQDVLDIGHPAGRDQMKWMWIAYRKSGQKKRYGFCRLGRLAERYASGHSRCFWADKGRGPCRGGPSLEHIKPRDKGGTDDKENLTLACARHNSSRGLTAVEEYIRPDSDSQSLPLFAKGSRHG